ncbi:hypothetical protein HRG_000156 [Hirsutella rhossiliensis]|uniref:Uncharacterized protein n=1 Tax=Hirsutella rhossiliensis TaxID=111463 RepID=A0A9P8N878_9HYPO|nr:uncharacterized protein HRG_00156 [Hirsutella rhossiliensis]KAH0967514.1 hypothetical protein HRG_00156 [Hirsutella rhossiliensis]
MVQDRLRAFGGFHSLDPAREKPRYKLLCDACVKGDLFYIIFHQLFCLWSTNREVAYTWLVPERAVVDSVFGLLLQVLRRNSDLPAIHLHWFASFPLGFKDVAGFVPRRQIHDVLSQINFFLQHFVTGWGRVLANIDERRYPPLVCEFQSVLMCTSPVLQWVLFTSSRRRLGIEDVAAYELYRLFTTDRNNESRHGNGSAESCPNSQALFASICAVVPEHGECPVPRHMGPSDDSSDDVSFGHVHVSVFQRVRVPRAPQFQQRQQPRQCIRH